VSVSDPRIAARLLEMPPGAVVGLGRLLGLHGGRLHALVGGGELSADPGDIAGRPGRAVLRLLDLVPGRVQMVAAGRRGSGHAPGTGDQGQGKGGCP
jgi:hypothetical protein